MAVADRFIVVAVLYAVIGMVLGIIMGAQNEFTMAPVHAHINLIGWVGLALVGLTYKAYPGAVENGYATVHFWLANAGIIAMMPSLALVLKGDNSLLGLLIAGEFATVAAMALFLYNLWKGMRG
jgi:cbb3-type cytochrome oxidase subunit 1